MCSFEVGTDVAKTYLKNEVLVEGYIAGGDYHAAELQQLSWSFGGEKSPFSEHRETHELNSDGEEFDVRKVNSCPTQGWKVISVGCGNAGLLHGQLS